MPCTLFSTNGAGLAAEPRRALRRSQRDVAVCRADPVHARRQALAAAAVLPGARRTRMQPHMRCATSERRTSELGGLKRIRR